MQRAYEFSRVPKAVDFVVEEVAEARRQCNKVHSEANELCLGYAKLESDACAYQVTMQVQTEQGFKQQAAREFNALHASAAVDSATQVVSRWDMRS